MPVDTWFHGDPIDAEELQQHVLALTDQRGLEESGVVWHVRSQSLVRVFSIGGYADSARFVCWKAR